jgi:hypothetical protein
MLLGTVERVDVKIAELQKFRPGEQNLRGSEEKSV